MMDRRWPNLLIVGAAKSGTTTLHYALGRHPQVFMSRRKEPGYFVWPEQQLQFINNGKLVRQPRFLVNRLPDYLELFSEGEHCAIRGESSTTYLFYYEQAIANIYRLHPAAADVHIIIVLRHPAERAYSQYMHKVRDGAEPLTFEQALEQEAYRQQHQWHFDYQYVRRGFYYDQVKAYLEQFRKVRIFLYEDLRNNPQHVLEQIQQFLGIDVLPLEVGGELNVSGKPRLAFVNRFLKKKNVLKTWMGQWLPAALRRRLRLRVQQVVYRHNLEKMAMHPETRQRLIELYRPEILRLQALIGRDLSAWLT